MMNSEQIAKDINRLYDIKDCTGYDEDVKNLVKNITGKNASMLFQDLYDGKSKESMLNLYHIRKSLAALILYISNDELFDILDRLTYQSIKTIKEYSDSIICKHSLYSFILRRNTLIKRYNLTRNNYIPYNLESKDLHKICELYTKQYDLSDDLKDIDFYKQDIALLYDIDKAELSRTGKNKTLFDHFEKCIKAYNARKEIEYYITQQ